MREARVLLAWALSAGLLLPSARAEPAPAASHATTARGATRGARAKSLGAGAHAEGGAPPSSTNPLAVAPEADPLAAFHQALARTLREGTKTRVLFFGDSHVASDCMSGRVRERLQAVYGDGGPGFLMLGKPWPHFHHERADVLEATGLKGQYVRKRPESDALPLGLSGVAMHGDDTGEPVALRMQVRASATPRGQRVHNELFFLERPAGGGLQVSVDGALVGSIPNSEAAPKAGYFAFEQADDAPHELELRSQPNSHLTLFGLVSELEAPGVVLDTLGVPGARARVQLYWDQALFHEHVQRRAPDLWVLAYGTNESTDVTQPLEDYVSRQHAVLKNMRSAAPQASCLLVGPTDFPERVRKGVYQERERTRAINEIQRQLASEYGCAFFDTIAAMGGPLSMLEWAKQDPPLGGRDLIHLTKRGYATVGDRIADLLLSGAPAPSAVPAALSDSTRSKE